MTDVSTTCAEALSTEFWPRLYTLLFLFFMTFDIRDSRFDQIIRRELKEG